MNELDRRPSIEFIPNTGIAPHFADVTFQFLSNLTAQFETQPLINDLLQLDLRPQEHFASGRWFLSNAFRSSFVSKDNEQHGRTLTGQQANTPI